LFQCVRSKMSLRARPGVPDAIDGMVTQAIALESAARH